MSFPGICLLREPQLSPLNWFPPFYVQVILFPLIYTQVPISAGIGAYVGCWVGAYGKRERGFSLTLLFLSTHQVTPPTSREQGQRESLHAVSKLFRIKVSKKEGQKVSPLFYRTQFSPREREGQIVSVILGGVKGEPRLMLGLDENNVYKLPYSSVGAGV